MTLTQKQQNRAAHRQLVAKGWTPHQIVEQDQRVADHIRWQRKIAQGGATTWVDMLIYRLREDKGGQS